MNNRRLIDHEEPCRLMIDFPDVYAMNDFVAAMKIMGVLFEDAVLCHATPEDFNKKTGGVARRQTATLASKQRYEREAGKLTKIDIPRRND